MAIIFKSIQAALVNSQTVGRGDVSDWHIGVLIDPTAIPISGGVPFQLPFHLPCERNGRAQTPPAGRTIPVRRHCWLLVVIWCRERRELVGLQIWFMRSDLLGEFPQHEGQACAPPWILLFAGADQADRNLLIHTCELQVVGGHLQALVE